MTPPTINFPAAGPSVDPTGGGAIGGHLAAGTYFLFYTLSNTAGAVTFVSPNSTPFTVAAGAIPQVTFPALPAGVVPSGSTGYSLFLSDASARPGSAALYASSITTMTDRLVDAAPPALVRAPDFGVPHVPSLVYPTGGSLTGGKLASGTYFLSYTFVDAAGAETPLSVDSEWFTVAGGNIPLVTLPPLPSGARGYNLYLSDPSAMQGSATRYATAITTTTYRLADTATHAGSLAPRRDAASAVATVNPVGGGGGGRPARAGHVLPGLHIHVSQRRGDLPRPGLGPVHGGPGRDPRGEPAALADGSDGIQPVPVRCLGASGFGLDLCDRHHREVRQPGTLRALRRGRPAHRPARDRRPLGERPEHQRLRRPPAPRDLPRLLHVSRSPEVPRLRRVRPRRRSR